MAVRYRNSTVWPGNYSFSVHITSHSAESGAASPRHAACSSSGMSFGVFSARFDLRPLVLALLGSLACCCGPGAGTYCQSGPKYGTQCYAEPDVRRPAGGPGPVEDGPRKGEPPSTPPPTKYPF
jgi:hypothetical protein